MIFSIALVTAWRPVILYNLELSEFKRTTEMGEEVYKITSRIVALEAKKTAQCGLQAVNDKPLCLNVLRRSQLGGHLWVSDDMEEYLCMTEEIHEVKSKLFLIVNYFGTCYDSYEKLNSGRITKNQNWKCFKFCNLGGRDSLSIRVRSMRRNSYQRGGCAGPHDCEWVARYSYYKTFPGSLSKGGDI